MDTKNHISNAEHFGRWLGAVWRSYVRRERQTAAWLVAQGVPAGGATTLLWIIKLSALAILLYAAFWLALLFVFVVAAARVAEKNRSDDDDTWPFSTLEDLRKTPGYDPVPYNDFEHPDFPDEKGN